MTTLLTRQAQAVTPIRSVIAPRERARVGLPLAAGLFASLISVAGNWIPSLWYDEAATVTSATRSWAQLFAEVQRVDAVHAAYYSAMHVVFEVFGYSPFTLRLPSALAVGVTAALIVVLVRMIATTRLAITSAVLFAVIPRVAWSGGEGRSYAISSLLAVAVTLLLVVALHRGTTRWWVAYAAAVLVASTVFLYIVLVVVAHGVTVLALRHRALSPAAGLGSGRHPFRSWLLAASAAGAALLPFAILVMTQGYQVKALPTIGEQTLPAVLITQWFWKSPGLALIAWLLVGAAIVIMVAQRRRTILGALVLPALFLPTVALILVSALYLPLYSPHYLTMCAPFLAIAMALPVSLLSARWLRVTAVLLIAAFALPNLVAERQVQAKEQSSWSQVAGLIASERAAAAAGTETDIIFGPLRYHLAATTRTIEYAYPAAFAGTVDVTLSTPAAARRGLWETHHRLADDLPIVQQADVAYLITSVKQDRRPVFGAELATIGWHATASWHFTNINVVKYEFTPATAVVDAP